MPNSATEEEGAPTDQNKASPQYAFHTEKDSAQNIGQVIKDRIEAKRLIHIMRDQGLLAED